MKYRAWLLGCMAVAGGLPACAVAQEAIVAEVRMVQGPATLQGGGPDFSTGQANVEAAIKAGAAAAKRRAGTSVANALGRSLARSKLNEHARGLLGEVVQGTVGKGAASAAVGGNALDFDNNPSYFAFWDHPYYTPDVRDGHRHFRRGASAVWLTGAVIKGEPTCDAEYLGLAAFTDARQAYPGLEESARFRPLGTDHVVDMHEHATYCEQTEAFILATQKHRAAGGSFVSKPGGPFGSAITTRLALDPDFPLSKRRYAELSSRRLYYRGELQIGRRSKENTLILTINPAQLVKFPFLDGAWVEFCGPGMTYYPWDSLYGRKKSVTPTFQVEVPLPAQDADAVVPKEMRLSDPRGSEWDTVFFSVGTPEPMQPRFGRPTYRVPVTIEAIHLALHTDPSSRSEASTRFALVTPPAASNTCGREPSLWPPL